MSDTARPRSARFGSVRARVTVVVAALSALAFGAIAVVAPDAVGEVLEDDLLVAEAENALEFAALFTLETVGDADTVLDLDGQPLEVEPGVVFSIEESFPAEVLPSDVDFVDVDDLADVVTVDLSAAVDDRIELLQSIGAFDDLIATAGGAFATDIDPVTFAVIAPDGTFETVVADVGDVDVPILTQFELDDLLFDELGVFASPDGAVIDVDTGARPLLGVRDVDDVAMLVSVDASTVDRSVDRVRAGLWIAVPFLTLVIAGFAWLVTSRALRPVRSITDQAATISGGSLDARVPVPEADDEIATLAVTVNEMLDRIEDDAATRRRFVSDASHELRSPVAVMRNEAEVALLHPDAADPDELATTVAAESQRLSAIIDDLLALARGDEGVGHDDAVVDLDDIVLAEAARTRRVPIDVRQVSGGQVRGRPDELARMVGHLLDNAARHANKRIDVGVRSQDGSVVLTVDDDGPGIPPEQRELVFDRFARLDDARTRDQGGAGLGLAVVRSIAERSGASVVVTGSPLGGARFAVAFD